MLLTFATGHVQLPPPCLVPGGPAKVQPVCFAWQKKCQQQEVQTNCEANKFLGSRKTKYPFPSQNASSILPATTISDIKRRESLSEVSCDETLLAVSVTPMPPQGEVPRRVYSRFVPLPKPLNWCQWRRKIFSHPALTPSLNLGPCHFKGTLVQRQKLTDIISQ